MVATRRKYTRKEKLAAVIAADMVGVTEAGRRTGIAKQTISYWRDNPELSRFVTKTREDEEQTIRVAFHLIWTRLIEVAPNLDPRDAVFAAKMAADMLMLSSGRATSRSETVTDGLNDHEKDQLRTVLREAVHAGD